MTRAEFCAFARAHDNFVILTHRRPDGDTIGSAGALCLGLRQLGKTAFVLTNEQFTPRFDPFLDGLVCEALPAGATVISADIASEGLLSFDAVRMGLTPVCAVDHHGSNSLACPKLVEADKAACGEIIHAILLELGVTVTKRIAECLYVAISTDTGCFKFSNTTSNTHRTAAALIEAGADVYPINKLFSIPRAFPPPDGGKADGDDGVLRRRNGRRVRHAQASACGILRHGGRSGLDLRLRPQH